MATIELAKVTEVNLDKWTVSAQTLFTDRDITHIKLGSSYCSSTQGATSTHVPEVGSYGYIIFPDTSLKPKGQGKDEPVMLGFVMPDNLADGYRGGRPDSESINPGDCIIKTTGGSKVLVKREGSVIISGGDGMSQRIYNGRTNSIFDVCGNYSLATEGGFMEWRSKSILPTSTGATPITLTVGAKKLSTDQGPRITFEVGNIFGQPDKVFKIELNAIPGLPAPAYKYLLDTIGNVIENVVSKKISATTQIVLDAPKIDLGEGATEPILKGDSFKEIFLNHTHGNGNQGSDTTSAILNDPTLEIKFLSAMSMFGFIK